MNAFILNRPSAPVSGAYRAEVSRGGHDSRVSSQWCSRPDDERFLNLDDLYRSVKGRADAADVRTVYSSAVQVVASREDADTLQLIVPGRDEAPPLFVIGREGKAGLVNYRATWVSFG